jgi:heme exporter protein C
VSSGKLSGLMLFSFFIGMIVFTMLYVWLVLHRQRVMAMQDALDDRGLDDALAARRDEAGTATLVGVDVDRGTVR